jgi:hypothetical protein
MAKKHLQNSDRNRHPGGRPTTYSEEMVAKLQDKLLSWNPFKGKKCEKTILHEFFSFSTLGQVAKFLGIDRNTLDTFKDQYPEFFRIIKVWEVFREDYFVRLAPYYKDRSTQWIFLSKNFLHFSDHTTDYLKALEHLKELFRLELMKHPEAQKHVLEILDKVAKDNKINVSNTNEYH